MRVTRRRRTAAPRRARPRHRGSPAAGPTGLGHTRGGRPQRLRCGAVGGIDLAKEDGGPGRPLTRRGVQVAPRPPAAQLVLEARRPPADALLGRRLHEQAAALQAEAPRAAGPGLSVAHQQLQLSSFLQINIGPRGVWEGLDAQRQVPGGREGVGPQVDDESAGGVHPLHAARGAAQVHLLHLLPVGLVRQPAAEGKNTPSATPACAHLRAPARTARGRPRPAGPRPEARGLAVLAALTTRSPALSLPAATRPPGLPTPTSSHPAPESREGGAPVSAGGIGIWLPGPLDTWTLSVC